MDLSFKRTTVMCQFTSDVNKNILSPEIHIKIFYIRCSCINRYLSFVTKYSHLKDLLSAFKICF
jgi:hypothetical protein